MYSSLNIEGFEIITPPLISGVYIFNCYILLLPRGVGGPPCYRYKVLQSGGVKKLALHRGCNCLVQGLCDLWTKPNERLLLMVSVADIRCW